MVRAILEDRKSQTRRVIKPQPGDNGFQATKKAIYDAHHPAFIKDRSPYQVGQKMWVRETWKPFDSIMYKHSGKPAGCHYKADDPPFPGMYDKFRWRPSIFMPRWASRITLEVTDIRVERLNEISEEDCIKEGSQIPCAELPKSCQQATMTERTQFSRIWDSINKKKYPWLSNPWVWVISFKRIEK